MSAGGGALVSYAGGADAQAANAKVQAAAMSKGWIGVILNFPRRAQPGGSAAPAKRVTISDAVTAAAGIGFDELRNIKTSLVWIDPRGRSGKDAWSSVWQSLPGQNHP